MKVLIIEKIVTNIELIKPAGEQFSYDWLQLINEIYTDEVVVIDHIILNQATHFL